MPEDGATQRRTSIRVNDTQAAPSPPAQSRQQALPILGRVRAASTAPASPFEGCPPISSLFTPELAAQPGSPADPRASLLRVNPTRDSSVGSLYDGITGALPETGTEPWPDDGIVHEKRRLRARLLSAGTRLLNHPAFQMLQLAAILFVLLGPAALVYWSAPDSANLPTDVVLIVCMALFLSDTGLTVLCHSRVSPPLTSTRHLLYVYSIFKFQDDTAPASHIHPLPVISASYWEMS